MNLGSFPIALMLVGFLIPVIYCAIKRKEHLKKVSVLFIMGLGIVALYPLSTTLSEGSYYLGLIFAQMVLFIFIPLIVLMRMEHWSAKKVLVELGVTDRNIYMSLALGLIAAAVTISVTYFLTTGGQWDTVYVIVMFSTAIGEEFIFRGVLLLYLKRMTGTSVAVITSIVAFVMMHGQYLDGNKFIISTIVQAFLLTAVALKTSNIIGPWVGHGLNRFVPQLLKAAFP
jgi:membrane protease YdiL (CAAX protease family)